MINGGHDWEATEIWILVNIWKFLSNYDVNGLINCGFTEISVSNDKEIEIFPNPSSDLTTKFGNKKKLNFKIFSSFGRIVMTGNINNNEIIDVSELDHKFIF